MEKEPPLAVDVGREALDDVKRNFSIVKSIVMPIIPVLLGLSFLDVLLNTYFADENGNPPASYSIFSLFMIFFTAWVSVHYILRWHLFTIKGSAEHQGTWTNPDTKYKKFFFKTLFLQFFAIVIFLAPLLFFAVLPPVLAMLVNIPIWIFAFYAICRLSFILPATVMGHTPTYSEIWKFAKGLVGKTLWAPIRVCFVYLLLFILYFIVATIVLTVIVMITGNVAFAESEVLLFIVFVVPSILMSIFFGLVYVGVLSRYYVWGLKNRTDAYGDFK